MLQKSQYFIINMKVIIFILFIISLCIAPIFVFAAGTAGNPQAFTISPYILNQIVDFVNYLFRGIYNFGEEIASYITQVLNQNEFIGGVSLPVAQNNNQSPPNTFVSVSAPAPNVSQIQSTDSQTVIVPIQTESLQDQLDDIQEKIDIIRQQIQILIAQQNQNNQIALADKDKISDEEDNKNKDIDQDKNKNIDDKDKNIINPINYPKILISEVQTAGGVPPGSDDKQEFVELYNPNNQDVPLDGWYLQRKTSGASSWSTYASNNLFSGKIISANRYFLIARTGYYSGLADIFTDNPITNDNSLALKNPNGDISDKLGFGNSLDPELLATQNSGAGQSIGRKVISGIEQDTDDNSADFELQTPTPKAQNVTYVAPALPSPPPALKNILISEIQVAGATAKDEFVELYNPNNVDVNLSGFSLKKKTSGGTESNLVSSASFSGTITALGYFLITPQINDDGTKNYIGTATPDLYYSGKTYSIAPDNTVLLYNNDATPFLIDKVGFGSAQDFESQSVADPGANQSIGRKVISGIEQDTDDNSADFELQTPTPKAQNVTYVVLGADATVISAVYTVSSLTDNAGTITNVVFGTSKADFEAALIKGQTDQTWDDSEISDPVATGNTLVVTAQNGTTKATYTITVNESTDTTPPSITSYTLNGSAQNLSFNPNTSGPITIVINASEPVDWVSAKIYKSDDNTIYKNKSPNGDGTNTTSITWDGTLTKPTVGSISDGVYLIKIHIKDLAGNDVDNIILSPYTITVDTTTPPDTPIDDTPIDITTSPSS